MRKIILVAVIVGVLFGAGIRHVMAHEVFEVGSVASFEDVLLGAETDEMVSFINDENRRILIELSEMEDMYCAIDGYCWWNEWIRDGWDYRNCSSCNIQGIAIGEW